MFLAGAALLMALNLRPGATSVGPVLEEIRTDLALSGTVVGVLAALPGFSFAIVSLLAIPLARKTGLNMALTIAAGMIFVGLFGRVLISNVPLFLILTMIGLAGMGLGNVFVPPFIRRNFPFRVAVMTAVYSTGLAVGATTASLLSAPLNTWVGWRGAIGLWGVFGFVAFVVWTQVMRLTKGPSDVVVTTPQKAVPITALFRSRRAIAMGVFFGIQSMQAYFQFAYAPQIFRDGGVSPAYAGVLISIIVGIGIPGGMAIPGIVARAKNLTPAVLVLSGLLVVGNLGMLYAPGFAPWLWATSLGLSGLCFPMAIAFITARTRDVRVTMPVSAFVQSMGYSFSAIGPFVVGVLYDYFGAWDVPLWTLTASAVVLAVAGVIAARPGAVDDDLES